MGVSAAGGLDGFEVVDEPAGHLHRQVGVLEVGFQPGLRHPAPVLRTVERGDLGFGTEELAPGRFAPGDGGDGAGVAFGVVVFGVETDLEGQAVDAVDVELQ